MGVKRFARAIRSHWSIENGCHWVLDMTFREDESRLRGPQIRENFAWLNRFTLSLLKQHGYQGYCLAECAPPSSDPERVLQYFRALYHALGG